MIFAELTLTAAYIRDDLKACETCRVLEKLILAVYHASTTTGAEDRIT